VEGGARSVPEAGQPTAALAEPRSLSFLRYGRKKWLKKMNLLALDFDFSKN
jgi:hypothetical protein